jgi:hypothetical protein
MGVLCGYEVVGAKERLDAQQQQQPAPVLTLVRPAKHNART